VIAKSHLVPLSFASGTMLGLTLCGSAILRRSEAAEAWEEFQRLTSERTVCVRQQIESTVHAASSISLALGAPECGTVSQFDSISDRILRDHPEILALGWTGQLATSDTVHLSEVHARESLPDLRSLDLRGSPPWSEAVDASIARHEPTFAPMGSRDPAIQLERRWLFVPVESDAKLCGFVAALVDLGRCVEDSRHGPGATAAGIDMYLMETGEHVIGPRIHAHPSGTRENPLPPMPQPEDMFRSLHQVEVVSFVGRSWAFLYAPAPSFEASRPTPGSHLLMANGIVCALLCAASGLTTGWFARRQASRSDDVPSS
jgi:hypothetical protein